MKKKAIPFWLQIVGILLTGVLLSGVVLAISIFQKSDKNDSEISEEKSTQKYTVTFAYQDGTIIGTKSAEEGEGVFPPEIEYNGVFRGWSGAFNSVKGDIEVHPIVYSIKEQNLFYFNSLYVQEGKEFALDVFVDGKVSVSAGTLKIEYDTDVLEYKQSEGIDGLSITEEKKGELIIKLECSTPLKDKTLLSKLTFYAKIKDAYSTQINLSANDIKTMINGQSQSADCSTINNKIYFLQEVTQ